MSKNGQPTFGKFTSLAVTAALALGLVLSASADAQVASDCGDAEGGPNDIKTLDVSYDALTGDITVTMTLCGGDVGDPSNRKTHYRVHFDYKDSEGMLEPDTIPNTECVTTSDDRIRLHNGVVKGSGDILPGSTELVFTINEVDFDPPLVQGDFLYIWGDTKAKNIRDRFPNTQVNENDSCAKPQAASEVITLVLKPPAVCPTDCLVAQADFLEEVTATEHDIPEPTCRFDGSRGPEVILIAIPVGTEPVHQDFDFIFILDEFCGVKVDDAELARDLTREQQNSCASVAAEIASLLGKSCDISPPP